MAWGKTQLLLWSKDKKPQFIYIQPKKSAVQYCTTVVQYVHNSKVSISSVAPTWAALMLHLLSGPHGCEMACRISRPGCGSLKKERVEREMNDAYEQRRSSTKQCITVITSAHVVIT